MYEIHTEMMIMLSISERERHICNFRLNQKYIVDLFVFYLIERMIFLTYMISVFTEAKTDRMSMIVYLQSIGDLTIKREQDAVIAPKKAHKIYVD